MNLLLWTTFSILFYSLYMIRKIYDDKSNKLYGLDIAMSKFWNKAYMPVIFEFEQNIPNLNIILLSQINKWIAKNENMLFLKKDNNNYIYDKTIFSIKKFLHKLDTLDLITINKLAVNSGLSSIICYTDNSFCFCFNHTFFDGYSCFTFLQDIFDNGITDCVFKYNYTPVITELQCIPTINNLSELYEKRNIDYSPDYRKSDKIETEFLKCRYKLSIFKQIKKQLSNHNIKINFNAITSAFLIYNIFKLIPKNITKLNIAIIAALNTNVSAFNNYGFIMLSLKRSDFTDLRSLIIFLNNYYNNNFHLVLASYLISNIFENNSDGGGFEIDVLLSGGPIVLNKKLSLNNISTKSINCYNPYTSVPFYCCYISCDKYINFTFSIRSKDINTNKIIKQLNNSLNITY